MIELLAVGDRIEYDFDNISDEIQTFIERRYPTRIGTITRVNQRGYGLDQAEPGYAVNWDDGQNPGLLYYRYAKLVEDEPTNTLEG